MKLRTKEQFEQDIKRLEEKKSLIKVQEKHKQLQQEVEPSIFQKIFNR